MKHKEQILKVSRQHQKITYKGIPVKLKADTSKETLKARRERQILILMKGEKKKKNLQLRLLYLAKTSFRFQGEISSFKTRKI